MSELWGEYVVALEVDRKTVTECISKLIESIDKAVDIEWDTLQVIIRKPTQGNSPFDTVISEEPGEEGKMIKFWTIGVKAKGTRKNEERYPKENMPDHPEERGVSGRDDSLQHRSQVERESV